MYMLIPPYKTMRSEVDVPHGYQCLVDQLVSQLFNWVHFEHLMSFFAECNRLMQYNQVYYHDDDMTAGSPLQSQCMPAIVFFLLQVMLTIDAAISASKGLALAFTLMSLVS